MKCITIQNKIVLEKILNDGIYYKEFNINDDIKTKSYEFIKNTYNYLYYPIFLSIIGYRAELFGISFDKDMIAIELDIPDNEVKIQKYYDWTDFIYFNEYRNEFKGSIFNSIEEFGNYVLLNSELNDEDTFQATIQYIKKEWLISFTCNISNIEYLHCGTGGRNVLRDLEFYTKK